MANSAITKRQLMGEFRRLSRTLFVGRSVHEHKYKRHQFESDEAFDLYLKLYAAFPDWYNGLGGASALG